MVNIGHRRSARSRDTRDAILEAAGTVFSDHGYEAASLEDVAAAAGVTKGTLYYHFSSKESIYAAVLLEYIGDAAEKADRAIEQAAGPVEALTAIIDLAIDDTLNPAKRYIHLQEMVKVDSELRAAIGDVQRHYHTRVANIIREGQEQGYFVQGDPWLFALILNGTIGRTAAWYKPTGRMKPDAFIELLRSFALRSLLVPGANEGA